MPAGPASPPKWRPLVAEQPGPRGDDGAASAVRGGQAGLVRGLSGEVA